VLMRKVKAKLEKPVAGKVRPMCLPLAGNDTVPISARHGGGVPSGCVCSRGQVVEVIDRKTGWRSFSSMKRQSLESDIKSKVRSISVKAGQRLVLTCPTYVTLRAPVLRISFTRPEFAVFGAENVN